MKLLQAAALISVTMVCCFSQAPKRAPVARCDPFITERLASYFESREEKPVQIINNTEHEPGLVQRRKITIGDRTVEWINEQDGGSYTSSVRIDGDLITFAGKNTVNLPEGTNSLPVELAGQWEQIRLYDLNGHPVIAIEMWPYTCTGLMCNAAIQFWYDINSKRSTFFGTYGTDPGVRLYRFTNQSDYYTVSTNHVGDLHSSVGPVVITYSLFKLGADGTFRVQKKIDNTPFVIKHTYFPDEKLVNGKWKKLKIRQDSVDQEWIEPLFGDR